MTRRENKYNAQRVILFGETFDSRAEGNRYLILRDKLERGEITDLEIHPRFELQSAFVDREGKRQRAIYYEADFAYTEVETGWRVVEDVKGGKATQTATFKIKAKMFRYLYGSTYVFRIVEI